MNDNQKKGVVTDAVRLMSVINSHLSEAKCQHSIKQIASEAFRSFDHNIKNGRDAFVGTRDVTTDRKSTNKEVDEI